MVLLLNNDDQARSVTGAEAIQALEDGLRQLAEGDAIRRPRIDNLIPTGRPGEFFNFSSMEGGSRRPGYYACRIRADVIAWPSDESGRRRRVTYAKHPGLDGGLVLLFSVDNAELRAILTDGYVQHLRVAASAAIGVKYLSRPDARTLGIIGSGGMARTFAKTFTAVRAIDTIRVFSQNQEHAEAFAAEAAGALNADVAVVRSAREAVWGADIVATATNSLSPVIEGEWLEPGMHVANCTSWELGLDACRRVDAVGLLLRRRPMSIKGYVDEGFAIRANAMSYAAGRPDELASIPSTSWDAQGIADRSQRYPRARYVDCIDWQTGEAYRRSAADEITTLAHEGHGTLEGDAGPSAGVQGVQFVSVGGCIYDGACRAGIGRELPSEYFLESYRIRF